jgi:hypothetical protein
MKIVNRIKSNLNKVLPRGLKFGHSRRRHRRHRR